MVTDRNQTVAEQPSTIDQTEVTFPVTGMTCASCVRRIEKALTRVEGVQQASVNLATEKANVRYDAHATSLEQLRAAVKRAGYEAGEIPASVDSPPATTSEMASSSAAGPRSQIGGAQAVSPAAGAIDPHERQHQRELDDLRRKWVVSLVRGLAMMALMYLPLGWTWRWWRRCC